jgi:hypothetical protein
MVEPKKKHKKKKGGSRASEAGSESTITPNKFAEFADTGRGEASGSVVSLPVRGITPSMIGSGHHARSAVSYYG